MSSGGGPVSAASGVVASAIAACCRRADMKIYRHAIGGSRMMINRRIASADFHLTEAA